MSTQHLLRLHLARSRRTFRFEVNKSWTGNTRGSFLTGACCGDARSARGGVWWQRGRPRTPPTSSDKVQWLLLHGKCGFAAGLMLGDWGPWRKPCLFFQVDDGDAFGAVFFVGSVIVLALSLCVVVLLGCDPRPSFTCVAAPAVWWFWLWQECFFFFFFLFFFLSFSKNKI